MKKVFLLVINLTLALTAWTQTPAKPTIEVSPGYLRFVAVQGTMGTGVNTVFSNDGAPFQITGVISPVTWLTATHRKAVDGERVNLGAPGNTQYRVEIKLDTAKARLGPINEKVRVVTDSASQPEILIAITGAIRPAYRVEPNAINFGQVAFTDTASTRTILLRSNDLDRPGDFVVAKVETNLVQTLSAVVRPTDRPGEFEVTLQILKSAPPGSFDGVVRVHTNSKYPAIAEVKVKGTVVLPPG